MKRVCSGSRSTNASVRAAGSMFETKRKLRSRRENDRRAWYAMAGPRSEPPIPRFTIAVIGLPVAPVQRPGADVVGKRAHPVEHRVDLADNVDTIHADRARLRCSQCGVQHRSILGGVDPVAAHHRVSGCSESGFVGECGEGCRAFQRLSDSSTGRREARQRRRCTWPPDRRWRRRGHEGECCPSFLPGQRALATRCQW